MYKVILGWYLGIRVKVKLKPRGKALGLFRTIQSAQNSSTSTVVELSHDSSDLNVLEYVIIQIDGKVRAVYAYQSLLQARESNNPVYATYIYFSTVFSSSRTP
jgi:hypothetical protein